LHYEFAGQTELLILSLRLDLRSDPWTKRKLLYEIEDKILLKIAWLLSCYSSIHSSIGWLFDLNKLLLSWLVGWLVG